MTDDGKQLEGRESVKLLKRKKKIIYLHSLTTLYRHTQLYVYTHTYTQARARAHTHTQARAHTHTHKTHTHTHNTHAHTHTSAQTQTLYRLLGLRTIILS